MHPSERPAWAAQEQHHTDPRPSKHGMLAQGPGVTKDGADLPLARTEGTVILPACKPALTAWRWGRIEPAYTAGLSQSAYRRCLGTLCSQRRKTDTHFSEWFIALKSEPCGNISKYPSSFPPKMQQNLLLFIFFINCFSPCWSLKNIWRKKRRRNRLFWGQSCSGHGLPALAGMRGGKRGVAEGSADGCVWTELFLVQDYRSRAGISL